MGSNLPGDPTQQGMQALSTTETALDLLEDGHLITRYNYADVPARPYFYPLFAPGNLCVTRSYPMKLLPGETTDHPHHRSLWIAHGDVNGADNWSEEDGHGFTIHQHIDALESHVNYASFRTTSLWTTSNHQPLLTQKLNVKAWRSQPAYRLIDFNIDLIASEGDVLFGDTKEGGILSVRVASTLEVPKGGWIRNASGATDEANCWGKHAAWCSYSGQIDNVIAGIAILNHPDSFRAPTSWHVRNYGLMTANPFGYSAFTHGAENGAYLLPENEKLAFRYRLVLYQGNFDPTYIQALYSNYISPDPDNH